MKGNGLHERDGTHPFQGAGGEEGEDQGEGANKEPWQGIDHADLLENDGWVVEGCQEGNVLVANSDGVVNEEIWETVCKLPVAA